MSEPNCLIPGFITHSELDPLVGSTRTRQRWETEGLLPKGCWINGFQRSVGLYPELVLARVVAGFKGGRHEKALRVLTERMESLMKSDVFEEIKASVTASLKDLEVTSLSSELLGILSANELLEPLQKQTCKIAAEIESEGIVFVGRIGKLRDQFEDVLVIETDDDVLKVSAESVLGDFSSDCAFALERVRVGMREREFVVNAGSVDMIWLTHSDEDHVDWDEMFSSSSGRPLVVPAITGDREDTGDGGDIVRAPRRIRVRVDAAIYADSNSMVRSGSQAAHA